MSGGSLKFTWSVFFVYFLLKVSDKFILIHVLYGERGLTPARKNYAWFGISQSKKF